MPNILAVIRYYTNFTRYLPVQLDLGRAFQGTRSEDQDGEFRMAQHSSHINVIWIRGRVVGLCKYSMRQGNYQIILNLGLLMDHEIETLLPGCRRTGAWFHTECCQRDRCLDGSLRHVG